MQSIGFEGKRAKQMKNRSIRDCPEYCVQFTLYLDGELDADERRVVEAHLEDCRACRETFNAERRFREVIQRAAPLYAAPDELRAYITSLIEPVSAAPPMGARRRGLWPWLGGVAATLAAVLIVGVLWGPVHILEPAHSSTFAEVAVDNHQRHTLGRLPLELISNSPAEISAWFEGKVPFSLELPNYQEASGQNKLYRLQGARLVGFKDDYAAYVAYEMGRHPISLVVTSSDNAEPEGGEQIVSKGLAIHYETISGLKVLTWSHRGLTYALVSDLKERGQQSCLVCHQGASDNDLIGSLDSAEHATMELVAATRPNGGRD